MGDVQDALPIVIVAVVALAAVVAVLTLVRSKGAYDHIREGDLVPGPEPAHVREEEIRQLLQARDARRAARGLPPLEAPAVPVDDGLREEVRGLVQARNARRVARGEPPLDVESEVERRLSELDG
jgi:hypothetical protein